MKTAIKVKQISKSFSKDLRALDKVSLQVEKGEVLVIMGPSGSGKSTLIRTFNGLESFDEGEIEVLGIPITSKHEEKNISLIRKRVGMVFQQFNLFPHLTVLDNVTLAPRQVKQLHKKDAEKKALDLLLSMGVLEQAKKFPNQLSGGEQQRVAIARALALNPELMLFDEPTSALDPERVHEVLDAIRRLAKGGMTMVIVTHEVNFAKEVSDRILFMDSGRVVEISTPDIFFQNAKQERSRKFLNQIT